MTTPARGKFTLFGLLARDARACGGCFHAASATAVDRVSAVTDHRMVLALSSTETTLWDQFRWAGNPEDFVWALPLSDPSRVRVAIAEDAFLSRVDQASAPTVRATCASSPPTRRPSGRSSTRAPGGATCSRAAPPPDAGLVVLTIGREGCACGAAAPRETARRGWMLAGVAGLLALRGRRRRA